MYSIHGLAQARSAWNCPGRVHGERAHIDSLLHLKNTHTVNYFIRNALSSELMTSLHGSLQSIGEQWPQVKVVILKALGPVFSSGHDLKELVSAMQSLLQFVKI